MATIRGDDQLRARLKAISDGKELLGKVALLGVSEAKKLAPVQTGNLRRTIRVGSITSKSASVVAGGTNGVGYAYYVETGTGIYGSGEYIRPKRAKLLSWKTRGGGRVFARKVRGRKATPYLVPGVRAALKRAGLKGIIVDAWNRAA